MISFRASLLITLLTMITSPAMVEAGGLKSACAFLLGRDLAQPNVLILDRIPLHLGEAEALLKNFSAFERRLAEIMKEDGLQAGLDLIDSLPVDLWNKVRETTNRLFLDKIYLQGRMKVCASRQACREFEKFEDLVSDLERQLQNITHRVLFKEDQVLFKNRVLIQLPTNLLFQGPYMAMDKRKELSHRIPIYDQIFYGTQKLGTILDELKEERLNLDLMARSFVRTTRLLRMLDLITESIERDSHISPQPWEFQYTTTMRYELQQIRRSLYRLFQRKQRQVRSELGKAQLSRLWKDYTALIQDFYAQIPEDKAVPNEFERGKPLAPIEGTTAHFQDIQDLILHYARAFPTLDLIDIARDQLRYSRTLTHPKIDELHQPLRRAVVEEALRRMETLERLGLDRTISADEQAEIDATYIQFQKLFP